MNTEEKLITIDAVKLYIKEKLFDDVYIKSEVDYLLLTTCSRVLDDMQEDGTTMIS
jgi:hypothetical protein